jgi:hypothetical protein
MMIDGEVRGVWPRLSRNDGSKPGDLPEQGLLSEFSRLDIEWPAYLGIQEGLDLLGGLPGNLEGHRDPPVAWDCAGHALSIPG